MPDILQELHAFINEFNSSNNSGFAIDSIRIDFSKQHKREELNKIGQWEKIGKHSNILHKLKKRLHGEELTSAHRLEGMDVYYFNIQDPPKYRRARMVIFGMKQYHKEPTPENIIRRVLRVLKDVTNIDVCFDFDKPPKLEQVGQYFILKPYKDSTYINEPLIPMIERIIFYDKALKNGLRSVMAHGSHGNDTELESISYPSSRASRGGGYRMGATMKKNIPTTREGAEQRIKEILAKHPVFQGAEVSVNFKDKKQEGRKHGK